MSPEQAQKLRDFKLQRQALEAAVEAVKKGELRLVTLNADATQQLVRVFDELQELYRIAKDQKKKITQNAAEIRALKFRLNQLYTRLKPK